MSFLGFLEVGVSRSELKLEMKPGRWGVTGVWGGYCLPRFGIFAFPDSSFENVVMRLGPALFSPGGWTMAFVNP